jgi:Flp pilus assembly protein TadD
MAVAAFDKVVELEPSHLEGWSNLGTARLELGMTEQAIEAYQHACDLRPQSATVWENLGVAHSRAGHAQRAVDASDLRL